MRPGIDRNEVVMDGAQRSRLRPSRIGCRDRRSRLPLPRHLHGEGGDLIEMMPQMRNVVVHEEAYGHAVRPVGYQRGSRASLVGRVTHDVGQMAVVLGP